jgi:hypothetical protein
MRVILKELYAELRTPDLPPILIGFSVMIAISGPFGSYAVFGVWERILFWLPVIWFGSIAFFAFRIAVLQQFPLEKRGAATVIAALAFAILSAPVLGLVFRSVFGPYFGTLAGWGEIGTLVFLISLGLCFLRHPASPGQLQLERDQSGAAALAAGPPEPRLLDRLEHERRGAIISLEVNDHYVVVTTDKGQSSILMRLSDAIAETFPVHGAQVHRSFWVAWSAVARAEQVAGRWFLELRCGARVPVSRANVAKLEKQGLI